MPDIADIFDHPPYEMRQAEKSAFLLSHLNDLEHHHYENCAAFHNIINAYGRKPGTATSLEELTFLPVRLFKEMELKSVPDDQVFKTLTSSGTTGQLPSRIFLDAETAKLQTKALVKIMQSYIGRARLPMMVLDHPSVIRDRRTFSARGAGILGLMNFGRCHSYALRDEDMSIDLDTVRAFAGEFGSGPVFLFGFTFMVWKYFVRALEEAGETIALPNAILVHSGGWKKLEEEAVGNEEFIKRLKAATGITKVHNFYGMVEQVGSIFVECEHGHLHAPSFSDIIIRDPADWSVVQNGDTGIIQVLSVLPHSYPGHSLVTEDRGEILGEDDCPCGRNGRYFRVFGRIPRAEIRGCSDTHAQHAA